MILMKKYQERPEWFIVSENKNKVYKLVKSLYHFKQTPKQWHKKIDYMILLHGLSIINW